MTVYVALVNVPSYLPMDDEPPMFEGENAVRAAWEYLATERMNAEDEQEDMSGYSDTKNTLDQLAAGDAWEDNGLDADGTGSIVGRTPGNDSAHDLGLAYSVQVVACAWTALCDRPAETLEFHPILTAAGNEGVPACERCARR